MAADKAPDLMAALQKSLAHIPKRVVRIELVRSFDITTDVYELQLSCGHTVEASKVAVETAPREGNGRLTSWVCPTCLDGEREEIVADLPGAD